MGYNFNREYYKKWNARLDTEFDLWRPIFKDLADNFRKFKNKYLEGNTESQVLINDNIVDGSPLTSVRVAAAGLMSGITPQALTWFNMRMSDKKLMEVEGVKFALDQSRDSIFTILNKSNYYQAAFRFYEEFVTFGTAVSYDEPDLKDGRRYYTLQIGEYRLDTDGKNRVNCVKREMQLTPEQMINEFGEDNVSDKVRSDWKDNKDTVHTVIHIVHENYNRNRFSGFDKKFKSVYYELKDSGDKALRVGGYELFPFSVARWTVLGNNKYGTDSPGMISLSAAIHLQDTATRLNAIDKKLSEAKALMHDSVYEGWKATDESNNLIVYRAEPGMTTKPVEMLIEAEPMSKTVLETSRDYDKAFISSSHFEDLFNMFAILGDRGDRTATEFIERKEEKILNLSTVTLQVVKDKIIPEVEREYLQLDDEGKLPEFPEEVDEAEVDIEILSYLTEGQKTTTLQPMERFVTMVQTMLTLDPNALDKVDLDQFIDIYSDNLGLPANIVRSDEAVLSIREIKRQQMERQQQIAEQAQATQNAKTMSETDIEKPSMLQMVQGGRG